MARDPVSRRRDIPTAAKTLIDSAIMDNTDALRCLVRILEDRDQRMAADMRASLVGMSVHKIHESIDRLKEVKKFKSEVINDEPKAGKD
jgi:hypothetical protein